MRVPHGCRLLLISMLITAQAGIAAGRSPDAQILSLIPNGAQIVAGINAPHSNGQPHNFLVFTRVNSVDLRDFGALVGVDDGNVIHQVFLVAGQKNRQSPIEHSLLAIGRFNHDRIYKAAIQNGARPRQYRSAQILELLPFARNRRTSNDVRWMAIIGNGLALFGTANDVREELDRHEDGVCVDESLVARLARLHSDDTTWYLMPGLLQSDPVRQSLAALSPYILGAALDGIPFQFGFQFGRHIRVDYDFGGVEPGAPTVVSPAQRTSKSSRDFDSQSSLGAAENSRGGAPRRGVTTISKERYEQWLAEVSMPGFGPW